MTTELIKQLIIKDRKILSLMGRVEMLELILEEETANRDNMLRMKRSLKTTRIVLAIILLTNLIGIIWMLL